jgi:CelD/BcsL family acetyltransferase involved in cellulose biosynthesis
MSESELICELARLEELTSEWDALAMNNAAPESAPAWMLGWWRHVAPPGAELRVVAVRDRDELIGIAPLYVDLGEPGPRRCYRLLASDFSGSVTPLALPDRAWEVAQAVAHELTQAEPPVGTLRMGALPGASLWVTALRERWPARVRPLALRMEIQEVPTASLHQKSFDAWLQSRNSRFRNNFRRRRRRFAEHGGIERMSTKETVAEDIDTFIRLHAERWKGRGGSRLVALGDRLPPLLGELAGALLAENRFRLQILEVNGEPICAYLLVAAGGEVVGVNLGWDERFKHLNAPSLSMLSMIEEAFRQGDHRLNFGWGKVDYKREFANGSDTVTWDTLLPVGPQFPVALMGVMPAAAKRRVLQSAKRVLPADETDRLRALRNRLSGPRS